MKDAATSAEDPVRQVIAKIDTAWRLKSKPYGGRDYACKDPEGYVWTFGSYDAWAK